MNKFIIFVCLTFLSSCSLAPFAPSNSARSIGAGNIQTEIGNANSTYHIKMAAGIGESSDLGFDMEFGAISTSAIFFKYSFLNNQTGLSMASEFGYGSADKTNFYYLGLVTSFAFTDSFELFLNPRFNQVSTNEDDIERDKYHGNVKITSFELKYLQMTYGMNIWFSESAGLSLYSTIYKGDDIETLEDGVFGASFLLKI